MSAPRFLVVRFSAIGDCVMASWAATAIRLRYPEAFLCWAIEARCSPVVDRSRLASDVAEFPRDIWKRQRWSPRVWREQLVAFTRLRSMNFDYGVDLQGHSKTALCLRLAAPRQTVAARATDRLSRRLNPVVGVPPSGMHSVDWNQEVLVKAFGPFPFPASPIMPDRPDVRKEVRRRLPQGGALATIAVSAGHPEKLYPAEGWSEVARNLLSTGYRVAFVGGRGDPHPEVPGATDLVGQLRLDETLEAIALSDVHLAADTGTGHMAAALGTPVVSVFGPTDPAVFRPYTQNGVVLRDGPKPETVAPQRIAEAALSLARRGRAGILG